LPASTPFDELLVTAAASDALQRVAKVEPAIPPFWINSLRMECGHSGGVLKSGAGQPWRCLGRPGEMFARCWRKAVAEGLRYRERVASSEDVLKCLLTGCRHLSLNSLGVARGREIAWVRLCHGWCPHLGEKCECRAHEGARPRLVAPGQGRCLAPRSCDKEGAERPC